MGKIVGGGRVTLDGIAGAPERWSFEYLNEEVQQVISGNAVNTSTIILGRTTYDEFARVWPAQSGPLADFLNNTPKIVVSTTLDAPEWSNSTVTGPDFAEHLAKAKENTDGVLRVIGSLSVARALLAADLLDELDLLIYPVAVGEGKRLFDGPGVTGKFSVKSMKVFGNGVVHAVYARV
ncbi:MAG: dihydrofolate reductase [Hamadaea sp.]|uniref:dihydrofolate reductase family protein n=1 Tax=Hamadaea sp. TaxID=2024425 RepID=UPI0017E77105|nr:dihydrofolate reductase family protein [Hamadaea sp.]NUR69524.1 dihydrofolate reductase [Hamadaea sp.]NUT20760.1 dihydrofolate reductase [Hamadaea sp.]